MSGSYSILMFKNLVLRIFEWVLRPVDTYLFKFNNKCRTIVIHVFLLIFCWFFKFLVGIEKKISNLCWLIQIQSLLKKWKLLFYLTCFFTSEVFFYHCKSLFKTFRDIRNNRSSHQRCSMKKGIVKNFTTFTGKHLCQSLFFNKVTGLRLATLLKKETLTQVFSREFCKILKNTYFEEHQQHVSEARNYFRVIFKEAIARRCLVFWKVRSSHTGVL